MATKKTAVTQASLRAVTPSGKREQSFYELVYDVARQIPRGRVTSYGAIAACLGAKKSARLVGWAMNNAHHIKPKIPAHRVVNSKGLLSGRHHFKPDGQMERLLAKEGIDVEDSKIKDFDKRFWDPGTEIA